MKGNGERKRFAVTALIINLFTSLTIVFFSPMEVVLMNQHEFYFSFLNAALFQMLAALAAAGIATAVMNILPRKIGSVLAGLSLGCGLAAYIQALFLNGGMVALDGKNMDVSGSTKVLNLVIWAVIIIGAVALLLINKKSVITGVRVRGGGPDRDAGRGDDRYCGGQRPGREGRNAVPDLGKPV